MRLKALSCPGLHEQRLEHVLDPLRRAEHPLDARTPAPAGDNCEIAGPPLARTFAVDHDRHPRREVRLADQQLAAAGKLYNNGL